MAALRLALGPIRFPRRRSGRQCRQSARTDGAGTRRRRVAGGVSRADHQRLSAGRSAAAAQLSCCLPGGGAGPWPPTPMALPPSSVFRTARARCTTPLRSCATAKSCRSRTSRRCPITACSTTSAIFVPAVRVPIAVDRRRSRRLPDLRRHLAARARCCGRSSRRGTDRGDQCLALGRRQADRARRGAGDRAPGNRLRDRLSQPDRRPGRSRLRRRLRCW